MRIPVIDLGECILCGICAEVSPSVFVLNEAGYMEVVSASAYPIASIDEAIKNCPVDCIAWEED